MGLFSFFKKKHSTSPLDREPNQQVSSIGYEQLKKEYKQISSSKTYAQRVDACNSFLSLLSSSDVRSFNHIIVSESKKEKGYYYHPFFGVFSTRSPVSELSEKISHDVKRLIFLSNKSAEFSAELASVPLVNISPFDTPTLKRGALSEMPDIHYSSVGKAFNRDKLPAFVVIDTETTGLKIQGGRIVELSAIRYEDFVPVAAFSSLVNPQKPIPTEAIRIHGITDADVSSAPTLAQLSTSFLSFVGSLPLVGYNLPFDLKFLYCRGIDLVSDRRKRFDALEIARKVYRKDGLETFSLVDVCDHVGIYRDDAHRSLSDCYATGKIFSDCIETLTE